MSANKTLSGRAGNTLRAYFLYTNKDRTPLVTEGWTARLQIRGLVPHDKILSTIISDDPDDTLTTLTTLTKVEEGKWELVISHKELSSYPPKCRWELEMVNNDNPQDTVFMSSGLLTVTPAIAK